MSKRRILAADHQAILSAQELCFGKNDNLALEASVLLVEDMVVNQKVIRIILESLGCKVTVADNGLAACRLFCESNIHAFEIFKPNRFDVILMDIEMPVMDGFSTVTYLKENFRDIPPIIALTASIPFLSFNDYQLKGFDDYLFKPVLPDELAMKIKFWTNERKTKGTACKEFTACLEEIESKPVANHYVVKNLIRYAQDNQFTFRDLFSSFTEDMDQMLDKTRQAAFQNNKEGLIKLFLNIRGMAGNFGATQLGIIVKLVETHLAQNPDADKEYLISLISDKYISYRNSITTEYQYLFGD